MGRSSMRTFDPTKLGHTFTVQGGAGADGAPVGSSAEETLAFVLNLDQFPPSEREYRFDRSRKWRFDFAWPDVKFAVEIEGLTHDGGRHQRIKGFQQDLDKYQAAMLQGWTVYRCSTAMVKSGTAVATIKAMLEL